MPTFLNHPNLVQLFGVVLKKRPIMIITEYMPYGSLRDFLPKYAEQLEQHATLVLTDVCVQVASAMAYLEKQQFVHRDLAARNCLVKAASPNCIQVKVADFGMARFLLDNVYEPSAGTKFPVRWAPPEVFQSCYTPKADVWSYGVLMWEVFTWCRTNPYPGKNNSEVYQYIVSGGRLQKPGPCPEKLYKLMLFCWSHSLSNSPSPYLLKDLHDLQERSESSRNIKILLKELSYIELCYDEKFKTLIEKHLIKSSQIEKTASSALLNIPFEHSAWNKDNSFLNENTCIELLETNFDRSKIDLVICLGGDGTLLYTSAMFQETHPPVAAFYMGSLGFLTPFQFQDFDKTLITMFSGSYPCVTRMRLRCQIIRTNDQQDENDVVPKTLDLCTVFGQQMKLPECSREQINPQNGNCAFHTLNEVVISRGMSAHLCDLVLTVNGKEVTHVQGDGLIISTPTGSTAYSMSAGASMLHPSVAAVMITPINPHSLSFRSIALPVESTIEISLSATARGKSAHVTCDGMAGGYNIITSSDIVRITHSPYPVPCLCSEDQVADWFSGLAQCLNWNARNVQASVNINRFSVKK
ncbi:hypothetical protein Ciccas_007603 [Cichlidogyrus casuarinus]|uniref:NAD(+) kinase n=1 Tax=Cichlidogyrus casuarinus TaxID=1844966 RepID=A0ABD2Q2L4_9PLAT